MATLEFDTEARRYRIRFRFGGRSYKRSLKTDEQREAEGIAGRVKETIRLLERGRLELPPNADPGTFILSDGKLDAKLMVAKPLTIKEFFDLYVAKLPPGTKEETTLQGEAIHRNHLLRHLKSGTLAPHHVDNVVMVIRTFPIRVGGPSGPLANEITWEDIQRISGEPEPAPEFTSVTRKLRRVAQFDIEAVKRACRYNAPTALAVMGLDRLDFANRGLSDFGDLTSSATGFVSYVESQTRVRVKLVGTGFRSSEAIRLSSNHESRKHVHA